MSIDIWIYTESELSPENGYITCLAGVGGKLLKLTADVSCYWERQWVWSRHLCLRMLIIGVSWILSSDLIKQVLKRCKMSWLQALSPQPPTPPPPPPPPPPPTPPPPHPPTTRKKNQIFYLILVWYAWTMCHRMLKNLSYSITPQKYKCFQSLLLPIFYSVHKRKPTLKKSRQLNNDLTRSSYHGLSEPFTYHRFKCGIFHHRRLAIFSWRGISFNVYVRR